MPRNVIRYRPSCKWRFGLSQLSKRKTLLLFIGFLLLLVVSFSILIGLFLRSANWIEIGLKRIWTYCIWRKNFFFEMYEKLDKCRLAVYQPKLKPVFLVHESCWQSRYFNKAVLTSLVCLCLPKKCSNNGARKFLCSFLSFFSKFGSVNLKASVWNCEISLMSDSPQVICQLIFFNQKEHFCALLYGLYHYTLTFNRPSSFS